MRGDTIIRAMVRAPWIIHGAAKAVLGIAWVYDWLGEKLARNGPEAVIFKVFRRNSKNAELLVGKIEARFNEGWTDVTITDIDSGEILLERRSPLPIVPTLAIAVDESEMFGVRIRNGTNWMDQMEAAGLRVETIHP